MGWHKETRVNNDGGAPYYAEYWVDSDGKVTEPMTFWNPAKEYLKAWEVVCFLHKKGNVIGIVAKDGRFQSTVNGEEILTCYSDALVLCAACLHVVGVEVAESYWGKEE